MEVFFSKIALDQAANWAICDNSAHVRPAIVERMTAYSHHWQHARASLPIVMDRLAELVHDAPADAMVTADWTVADTLAHLVAVAAMDVSLSRQTAPELPVPGIGELRLATTVDTVADMNDEILSHFTERRTPELVARLRADIDTLLEVTGQGDPAREVIWLGGARVWLPGLLAHLLNELNIHAWDIARGLRRPWHTDPQDATQFVDVFIAGVTERGYGNLLDRAGPVRPGRISVTFSSRVGEPVSFALTDGLITREPPHERPDVRLSYDPEVFNLMLFGRISHVGAVARGKLMLGGRRPWLLPAFRKVMRVPS
jgi:uncharacterized protein (TIGR03083 family)